ncbi:hypothetical protein QQF64_023641 [Cirrhinus molitorella]|uniref:PiggyBac transposable element-derived protein domain-containing protein n=1 Tax=Cirrhinus molitorella TaxID=172907 RepID=A0ABR3NJW2_9TELE
MERKLTRDEILDILFDSDAESSSDSDRQLSDSDEEAHLPENLACCDHSEAPAIPNNAGPASEGAVVEDFLPIWTSDPFSPSVLDFDNTTTGVQGSLTNPSEAECFRLSMSNLWSKWQRRPTAVILMGLIRKRSLKDYWTTDPVIQTPFFSTLFSLDRFQLLLRALHFADNTTANLRDPLNKIRNVFTSLMAAFGQMFVPHRDLCIDESLMLWKGVTHTVYQSDLSLSVDQS